MVYTIWRAISLQVFSEASLTLAYFQSEKLTFLDTLSRHGRQVKITLMSGVITNTTVTTFGDMLKFLRRRARLTQRELGLAVGYSEAQITRLEKNQRLPDLTALTALFVPALDLEDETHLVTQLIELAAVARRGRLPGQGISFTHTHENALTGFEDDPAGNLPFHLTSFIGREQEIYGVRQALGNSRLVTLTGPGGSGKTRLAIKAASGLNDAHQDGVRWVGLESLRDAALVPKAIANVLGILETPSQPLIETLASQLRSRQLLLLLDNCEHLQSACAELSDQLLRACPGLRILATSREALGLLGETVLFVPGLLLPEASPPISTADVSGYESIQLFVQRAQTVNSNFLLTNENAASIIQICRQLDGMPLAIELAAVQVKVLSVEQIAARLDNRFELLSRGNNGALPRHQTLRATLNWSHDLLSAKEQTLLRRLSVFAGGCSLDAAELVCATGTNTVSPTCIVLEASEIIELLSRLVDKSLIIVEVRNAEARYRLLETVRLYGEEKLQATGEVGIIQQQHAEYFMALVEAAEPGIQSAHEKLWLDRLEADHDNIRTALAWSLAEPQAVEIGLRIVGSLFWLWVFRNYSVEGSHWATAVLDAELQTRPTLDVMADPWRAGLRARALFAAAGQAWWLGDMTTSGTLVEESVTIYRALGTAGRKGLPYSLAGWGLIKLFQGHSAEARALEQESVDLMRELDDVYGLRHTLCCLTRVAIWQGDHDDAKRACEEDLAICRQHGIESQAGVALHYLGLIAFRTGDYAAACLQLLESTVLLRRTGMKPYLTEAMLTLGQVLRCQNDHVGGRTALQECLTLCEETGIKHIIFEVLASLGGAKAAEALTASSSLAGGHLERALTLLAALPALQHDSGYTPSPINQAQYDQDVAAARARLGDAAFAKAWAEGRSMNLDAAIAFALI